MSSLSVDGYPKKVGKLDLYVCNPAGWRQAHGSIEFRACTVTGEMVDDKRVI